MKDRNWKLIVGGALALGASLVLARVAGQGAAAGVEALLEGIFPSDASTQEEGQAD